MWYRRCKPVALLTFVALCAAASPDKVPILRGEVETPGKFLGTGLTAELYDIEHRRDLDPSPVTTSGAFQFHEVPLGRYEVRISRVGGAVLAKELVTVESSTARLVVRMPDVATASIHGAVVSVRQLAQPTSGKAVKAFQEADRLTANGQPVKAMEMLRRAIAIDPSYSDAYTNLGSHHAGRGEHDQAAEILERAVAAGAADAKVYTNLAVVYQSLKRPRDAERAVRQALTLDRRYPLACYLLGKLLSADPSKREEALAYLSTAVRSIPEAHVALAQVHAAAGVHDEALRELRAYLQTPDPKRRDVVEGWIAKLEAAREEKP
jgi:tetratricopeptide (TPR) repeat protein